MKKPIGGAGKIRPAGKTVKIGADAGGKRGERI